MSGDDGDGMRPVTQEMAQAWNPVALAQPGTNGRGGEDGDDGRRLIVDRRVLSAFWLDLAAVAAAEAETGHWTANVPKPETLARIQTQISSINSYYGSFSLDRGGWSLTLNY